MRMRYDAMSVSTTGLSSADTKKDKMHDADLRANQGHEFLNAYDGAEFVNVLIDVFGEPTEASYFVCKPEDSVLLRFNTSSTTDFMVSFGARGPGRASLRRVGDSFRVIEQRAYAKENKLATTRKDVLDALLLLKRR